MKRPLSLPRTAILAALLAPVCACVSLIHVLYGASFQVNGTVVDRPTDSALPGVEVSFIDTGLRAVSPDESMPRILGYSDNDGRINLTFEYTWCRKEPFHVFRRGGPDASFAIELSKQGYQSQRFHLGLSELTDEAGVTHIDLDKVSLEPD